MGGTSTAAGDRDPLYVVPERRELERAITSVTGVATAEVHRTEDGRDRLRISLLGGAAPDLVAWSVAATLRERFGIALDPAAIALRPTGGNAPAVAGTEEASGTAPGRGGDGVPAEVTAGYRGGPALAAAARAAAEANLDQDVQPTATPPTAATPVGDPALDPADATPVEDPIVAPGHAEDARTDEDGRPRPVPRRRGIGAAGPPDETAHAPDTSPAPVRDRAVQLDPSAARDPAPPPEPASGGEAVATRRRAAIAELIARSEGNDLTVVARLRLADREVVGQARGLGTRRGRWRTIALATLDALTELTGGQLRVDVDQVAVLDFPDLAHVTVSVTLLADHGEERSVGAAMVRDDPDRAVMRATLDAVNRRVEPMLAGRGQPA